MQSTGKWPKSQFGKRVIFLMELNVRRICWRAGMQRSIWRLFLWKFSCLHFGHDFKEAQPKIDIFCCPILKEALIFLLIFLTIPALAIKWKECMYSSNASSGIEVSWARLYLDGKENQPVEKDKLVRWGQLFTYPLKQPAIC